MRIEPAASLVGHVVVPGDKSISHRAVLIGARNMSNFSLLSEVGRAPKPVLLKRGLSSTVEDLLMAAEYIVKEGNSEVILCERGIKTFEDSIRYTMDISSIPVARQKCANSSIVSSARSIGSG